MRWTKKLVGNEDERAVSPVIGVILMVAITVILAAVIAAFVLDLGPSEAEPQAAVEIEGDGTSNPEVTLRSVQQGDGIMVFEGTSSTDTTALEFNQSINTNGQTVTFGDSEKYAVVAYSGSDDYTKGTDTLANVDDSEATTIVVVEEFTSS